MSKPPLSTSNLNRAAARLGCTLERLEDVCGIKAGLTGFDVAGRPLVRLEGDVFSELSGAFFDDSHPSVSHLPPADRHYARGKTLDERNDGEHARLALASSLSSADALKATRWGRFMLLGKDHTLCGHRGISSFVNAMHRDEASQLDCFVAFVLAQPPLLGSLRTGNVRKFFHLTQTNLKA
ncbi:uncharacterized protein DUF3380 [Comamonas sp. BIGb0124]|uniref:N-acetylmuramidase domain-containing protein n=1 Tax=Comamonas sp. BIGb0124 TaxID=2485130 RepID=UPI000FABE889|nr:N-acetylmuramidase domain-containing protein [Comamonas sp. BIGb0124]ROR25170.1 uncharacterized protein DUF3380 [Comamonas sp. BIGb0124]